MKKGYPTLFSIVFAEFFLVTNSWDPSQHGKELCIGKAIVDQAAKVGVKHFIFSSLPNVEAESKGKYVVPQFTDKAKIEEYMREKSPFQYMTFMGPAFYYQNFLTYFKIQNKDGKLTMTLPETKTITAFDVCQTGKATIEAFKNPEKWNGKFIPLAGENSAPQVYVDKISTKLGKPITLRMVPHDEYAKLPFSGARDMAQMFAWFNEYTYYGKKSNIWMGKEVDPSLHTFQEWLDTQKEIPTD